MRLRAEDSALLLVDLQQQLIPAIHEHLDLIANASALLIGARRLKIPIVFTEHCPDRIGQTVASLRALAPDAPVLSKTSFDAIAEPAVRDGLRELMSRRIIVCGTEAHVCVLQTVLGLHENGARVSVVADAVSSRKPLDREIARERLRDLTIPFVTTEMVLFEWIGDANLPAFRDLLSVIKNLQRP